MTRGINNFCQLLKNAAGITRNKDLLSNGEEYEILKTVQNTVIKKSTEKEEPH